MYQGVPPKPDWAFVKALKEFDPKLDVVFDRVAERFIIRKQRAWGKPWGVLLVETADCRFRQPDQRDIKMLYDGDLWRHGGVKEHILRGEERMKAHQEKQERDNVEEIKNAGRDDKIQLSNTWRKATNQGSKAPEFRKLDDIRKPGALTIGEIRTAKAAGRDPWRKVA